MGAKNMLKLLMIIKKEQKKSLLQKISFQKMLNTTSKKHVKKIQNPQHDDSDNET